MCTHKQSWVEKIVDRITRGSVPVDGGYWVDSRARRVTAPRTGHSRVPSLSSQPLSRQRCAI
jgi:hypothetical protein